MSIQELLSFNVITNDNKYFFSVYAKNNIGKTLWCNFEIKDITNITNGTKSIVVIQDILDSLLYRFMDSRNDYRSGKIQDIYMINKYGVNFLSNLKVIEQSDFSYFDCPLFVYDNMNKSLIIIVTDKEIVLIRDSDEENISLKITPDTANSFYLLNNKLNELIES